MQNSRADSNAAQIAAANARAAQAQQQADRRAATRSRIMVRQALEAQRSANSNPNNGRVR